MEKTAIQRIRERLDFSKDYYLRNPPQQPKLEICEYVRQNGILTPATFSFDEAKAYLRRHPEAEILCRSEHVQDYYGSSGLLKSPPISDYKSAYCYEGLRVAILNKNIEENYNVKMHCGLLGISFQEFVDGVSYSLSQYIRGYNVKVIADSAIRDKHHIFIVERWPHAYGPACYCSFKDGKPIHITPNVIPQWAIESFGKLVQEYEAIRNMDHFDRNNCPIMEFQIANGESGGKAGERFFLQYLRGTDFKEAEFVLSKEAAARGKPASFIRGATPKEGIQCNVVYDYEWSVSTPETMKLDLNEIASYDTHGWGPFIELMTRMRPLQMIDLSGSYANFGVDEFLWLAVTHEFTSRLFKTDVAIVHCLSDLYTKEELHEFLMKRWNRERVEIPLRVISDGNTACVERI
jgi:hypothetical protein